MNTYKATLSYCGQGYEGWQIQPDGHKTIQGELNRCLSKIVKSENLSTLGSGRTDSGVHGIGQVVRIEIPLKIASESLRRALNSHLPAEIRVIAIEECLANFNPVRDAKWKQYDYLLFEGESLPPHYFGRWTHSKYELSLKEMEKAIKVFEGRHDFINFSTKGTPVSSTCRTIYRATVQEIPLESTLFESWDGKLYKFSFFGEGFLKQMVRLLVGACIKSGRGKLQPVEISSFLGEEKEDKCAAVAPSDGLYLKHVEYLKDWPLSD